MPSMARVLVLADVHANLRALEAVIRDAREAGGFDHVWVLGDLVGYGPEPEECVSRLRGLGALCVAGNHDLGVTGGIDLRRFSEDAARVCEWTAGRLSSASATYLRGLPLRLHTPPFLLVHGSPRDPVWEYVDSADTALRVARWCSEVHCFSGHTHRPSVYHMESVREDVAVPSETAHTATLRSRLLINPGAVGQPRDGDSRAAYAVYDCSLGTVSLRRVVYDVDAVALDVMRFGLPAALGWRLHAGW